MKIPAVTVLISLLTLGETETAVAASSQKRLKDWETLTERLRNVPLNQRIFQPLSL